MNGLGKTILKNPIHKNRKKTVKIKVKLPHVNKNPLARKRIFVQTPFSHSTLNLERKKFTPQNQLLLRSISCFGVTKNIVGRLPENSRNSFVDLRSQKSGKRLTKKFVFSLKADMLYFDLKSV